MTARAAATTTALRLNVGERVRLAGYDARLWWRVQAASEHFAVCVRQVEFRKKGTLCYTVLDWRNGVRGPCNLIGQGWGDGSYSEAECRELLEGFERVIATQPGHAPVYDLEVSHRNRVPIEVLAHREARTS